VNFVFANTQANPKKPKEQTLPTKSNSGKMQAVLAQFSEKAISSIPKLNWSHLVRLLSVKNEDERNFHSKSACFFSITPKCLYLESW